ncbi:MULTISPECIES: thioredoxin family protein [unclassified Pseudomonas]|uniref:thioredoxin family protein n=1 Tax=unclassified Pseudomonas TaxID=196821 RepID=UPI002AC8DA5C|nr:MULTISPECIES: thioredoxin family protein [unclassified Pseudomonas]MEB0039974.1 thioredoxin family protein [Pseudomonas sp. MH10]MEB0076369.1 thioredoxin family protein [Pseudomonas sp. MH10out]MEB0092738.1 thioredoxin family protein [Pseudomonas sp. CCI4.2]MEB0100992.1 thioredoxin family protein [Pseudomonas sp. CCI3.2]MEB0119498.1 thioredoxin family protein [Pseudomonas sp. CCI1.2]
MSPLELTDFDIDHRLLELPGVSLLIFTGAGCASCRWARRELPAFELPVDRLCWIDAGDNGGAVQRYQVSGLPAMFVVRDGEFYGALHSRLTVTELSAGIKQALSLNSDELP